VAEAEPPPSAPPPLATTSAEPTPPPAPPVASAAPTSDSKESEEARRQPPSAMLTAREVAFLIDYVNSDVRQSADAECDKEAKGDPAAKGACLEKARDKFQPDVLRFKKDEQGKLALVIYKRAGSSLREVYLAPIEFIDETSDSIGIKFSGREKGQRPLFKSGKSVVRVPNDYSIELTDPQFGKLIYNAKIGLVANQ
jgi:hypothetical protein